MDCAVRAEASGSTGLEKTNSLRQFNYAQVIGVPTAAGIVPVIYPVLLHCKCPGGVRGIVHYGGTFDGRCKWYKEQKETVCCGFKGSYKYNGLEVRRNEEKGETTFKRHKGIAALNFIKPFTKWKGEAIWKAPYLIKGCDNKECCFNYQDNEEPEVEETKIPARKAKKKTRTTSCGCGRKK